MTSTRYQNPVRALALSATIMALAILCCLSSVSADTTQSRTFLSSRDDGHLRQNSHEGWDALRTSQDPAEVYDDLIYVKVNTRDTVIYRGYLFFDTSSLPDDEPITGAVLHIYSKCTGDLDDCQFYVLAGNEDYPHVPLQPEDYALPEDLPVCAHVDVDGWTHELAYRTVPLAALDAAIDTSGITRLCLVERRDQENETPPDPRSENELKLFSFEKGEGFQPYLEVFWGGPMPADATATIVQETEEQNPSIESPSTTETTNPEVNASEEQNPSTDEPHTTTLVIGFAVAFCTAAITAFVLLRRRARKR
ncbi:MAG: hypothetical protein JW846_01740 [Dehalococcoidia bacterium]|nr:hypothetical protein [Dehalococcoidia bacterium]